MKLPRDLSGSELGKLLGKLGYRFIRQVGGHIRYCTEVNGEHCQTIPDHKEIRPGTLDYILGQVADHHGLTKAALMKTLFDR